MKTKSYIHTLYRMALCLVAVLMTAACSDGLDTPDTPGTTLPGVEPGSVVLSLAGLPATRATSKGTEQEVERLDVLIFQVPEEQDNDLTCVYHRRFRRGTGTGAGTGVAEDLLTTDGTDNYTHYAVLGRVADFKKNRKYYVYVLANTHADKPEDAATVTKTPMQEKLDNLFPLYQNENNPGCSHDDPSEYSLDNLKNFVYTTKNIHLSGDPNNKPNVFVMDGMARILEDESDATALTLNGGDLFAVRNLHATLCRAAAKVTVTLTADPNDHHVLLPERLWVPNEDTPGTEENQLAGQASYEWQNVNQREDTYLVTPENYGTEGNEKEDFPSGADLESPSPTKYNISVQPGREGTFTAITYSYSHYWDNTASSYENAAYLTVRVPVIYCSDGIPDDFNYKEAKWESEESESDTRYTATHTADGTTYTLYYYVANYYKIPLGKEGRLDRNTHYKVTGNLTRPGSITADKPLELPNVEFQVVHWIEEHIDAGGESDVHYLLVNKDEYTIRNVSEDNTLTFSSSHPVTVTMTRAWHTNKRGREVDLLQTDENGDVKYDTDGNPLVVDHVEVAKLDGNLINKPVNITLAATPDKGLNGNIHLTSTSPTNNLVRHIKLLVTNTRGDKATVIIHQYPLDYIQFTEGYYSYWSSNGQYYWSNYEYYRLDKNDIGYNNYFTNAWWNNGMWKPRVGNDNSHHFRPRVVLEEEENKKIYSYWYNYNSNDSNKERLYRGSSTVTDYRMYHIQITSTSADYVLARPKLDEEGNTASGDDNAKRVSPSFMINSQLGATANEVPNVAAAKLYAAQYAEVYIGEDGETYVYDDWRLPTPAEIEITMKYQGTDDDPSESMFMVMNGKSYYTSNGIVENKHFPNNSPNCLRLVRDIFSEEDLKGKKVSDIFGTEGSGYTKR